MSEPGFIDHFERRGCYELALAMLQDCLHQLNSDPGKLLAQTQDELRWLNDQEPDAVVTCEQVLQTLGMQPEGGLQAEFRRIARDNPARALAMITGPKVSATLSSFRLSRVHEVAAASAFEAAEDTTVMARVRMGC